MAVDPVPWFVQAPAEHSAEVARTLAYQALGGREGLAREGDLFVQALPVPGGAVQVLPGAAGILNRGSGGGGQAYVGRVGSAVTVPIAATGSGAGRSDLIVFRVQDPQYGGAVPASTEAGPYIFLDVISGVPAGTTRLQSVTGHEADSAITLARIDMPASTGTVLDSMVTNVSRVANPRRADAYLLRELLPGQSGKANNSPGVWQVFPSVLTGGQVVVPEWAEWAQIDITYAGIWAGAGVAHVDVRAAMSFGGTTVRTQQVGFYDNATSRRYLPLSGMGGVEIPESFRGEMVYITPDIMLSPDQAASALPEYNEWSAVRMQVTFFESKASQLVAA